MKLIHFLLAHSKRQLVVAVLAGIVSGAANTGILIIINAALTHTYRSYWILVYVFLALCVVAPLARIASEILLIHLAQNALYSLRLELTAQILRVPLQKLEQLGSHRLLASLTDDIPTITNVIGAVPVLCINVAVVLSCLIYMGVLSWHMLLTVLAFMAVGICSYQFLVARAFGHLRVAREEQDALQKHFQALTSGMKELKIHRARRNAFLNKTLSGTATHCRDENITGLTTYAIAASWGQLLVFFAVGLLVFAFGQWTHPRILTAFSLCLIYLMGPLQMIMNMLPGFGRANAAISGTEQLGITLASGSLIDDTEHALAPEALSSEKAVSLQLIDVGYSYDSQDVGGRFSIGPICLSFQENQIVFITGGNGSGKTTLAKVLIGLYKPELGVIRLNKEDITDRNRDAYRQNFSVVFSDFFLFDSLLGLEGMMADESARAYLVQLWLAHKVAITNSSLSTINLSQGERKRLALLTAFLEDRPIYFFDEWAADQDPVFKDVFYYQILPELKRRGKVVFVISHDERFYHVADRVIKLDNGTVIFDSAAQLVTTMGA